MVLTRTYLFKIKNITRPSTKHQSSITFQRSVSRWLFTYCWVYSWHPREEGPLFHTNLKLSARSQGALATATANCIKHGLNSSLYGMNFMVWLWQLVFTTATVTVDVHRCSHSQWVLYPFCATGICGTHCHSCCSRCRSAWTSTKMKASTHPHTITTIQTSSGQKSVLFTCSTYVLFWGYWHPCFWISGDVSSGFQIQSGFCLIRIAAGEYNVRSLRSTSGATPADLLSVSTVVRLFQ